jgi:hypothetical protein
MVNSFVVNSNYGENPMIQWIGFIGNIETGKPRDLHGKIDGFLYVVHPTNRSSSCFLVGGFTPF